MAHTKSELDSTVNHKSQLLTCSAVKSGRKGEASLFLWEFLLKLNQFWKSRHLIVFFFRAPTVEGPRFYKKVCFL